MLKEFLRLDYRKLTALLADAADLAAAIGLVKVPHLRSTQRLPCMEILCSTTTASFQLRRTAFGSHKPYYGAFASLFR